MPDKVISFDVELLSTKKPSSTYKQMQVVGAGDLNSVEIRFDILDFEFAELEGATAEVLLFMRDGSFFSNLPEDAVRSGTVFRYTLKENEGNHAGITQTQIIVTVGDKKYESKLYEFEILKGLSEKVPREIFVHSWSSLTNEANIFIETMKSQETNRELAETERREGYLTFEARVSALEESIITGTQGKSAYDIAVDNGFIGTESEWLLSLQGTTSSWFEYEQIVPSNSWLIVHNLNKYPSVTIADSAGSQVVGDVIYLSKTEIMVNFSAQFSGNVYLN